jgi:hypothetical protein
MRSERSRLAPRVSRRGLAVALAALVPLLAARAVIEAPAGIRLELSPRICSLAAKDKQCETTVHASWHAPRDESLCLIVLNRPEIKRCWERYSEGTYSIGLTFDEDLRFELRDPSLERTLAAETLRVIREAVQYRHKRREPWNIFD